MPSGPAARNPANQYDGPSTPTAYDPRWQFYSNLTAAQQQWFRSQPQWLVTYAGLKRWQKEIAGITFSGIPIDTTDTARSLIDGLAVRAMRDQQANPSATYTLTSNGTATQLTVAQALALFDAVSGFIQACRAVEGQMTTGALASTVTSQDQIDSAIAAIQTTF